MASSKLSSRREQLKKQIEQINRQLVADGRELQKALDAWAELSHEYALLSFLAALADCYSRLVMRTPVDTGRARAGWHIEGEVNEWKPAEGDHPEAKGMAAAAISKEIDKLPSLTRADVVYVMSNIEYILPLEAGWSKQSSGFIGLFVTELRSQLEKAAKSLAK